MAACLEHSGPFGYDARLNGLCHAVRMRRALIAVCSLALVAAVLTGVRQARTNAGTSGEPRAPLSSSEVSEPIAGAPPKLAALRSRVSELRGGTGAAPFEAQLRALRGYPVVVNLWASWCAPCRRELPLFQREALARGASVAFLGVDVTDDRDAALGVLGSIPLPYPSFADPRSNIATGKFRARVFPTTAFYDARGRLVILKQGEFATRAQLAAAIDRYALGGA